MKIKMNEITASVLGKCANCGAPLIEQKFEFHGEMLTVGICPNGDSFDWEIPSGIKDERDPTNTPVFEESEQWASRMAQEMRITNHLTEFSISSTLGLTGQTVKAVRSLAREHDCSSVIITRKNGGLRMDFK